MKENVLDVLMYLFETYVDTEDDPEPDQNELRLELSRAGFGDAEIERALDWLDGLTDQQQSLDYGSQTGHGTRIYNEFEHERLDAYCVALELVKEVEAFVSDLPRGHADLKDQIRRAASSVVRNIAEGANRWKPADKEGRFVIAHGECGECHSALQMAYMFGLISEPRYERIASLAQRVAAMLTGLIKSMRARI